MNVMNKRQEIMGNALGDGRRALSEEVPEGYKRTEVGVIPQSWEVRTLGTLGEFKNGINKDKQDFGHGFPFVNLMDVFGISKVSTNSSLGLVNSSLGERDAYALQSGDVLFVRSSVKPEGVGLTTLIFEDLPNTVFSGFLIRYRDKGLFELEFKEHCFQEASFRSRLIASSTVSANTNISQGSLKYLKFAFPPNKCEQRAIAEALSDVDKLLGALEKLIAKKRAIKQAAMQQLLTGKTRLPGFSGAWNMRRLGDLLHFERPDRYMVQSTDYMARGEVPVLTANKSFFLGYTDEDFGICEVLPVIVFDDFTTDCKYVTFPFKVKSSAIKLLRAKHNRISLRYVFERLQLIRFPRGDHKRYYISEYQDCELPVPDYDEQSKIVSFLSDMDAEIAALERRRDKTRAIKQGMMQQLLTGRVRLVKSE